MKLALVILFLIVSAVTSQTYQGCSGTPNTAPLVDQTPVLLQTVEHGEKYLIQNGTNFVYIINVFGSPYQMGYAAGQLMAQGIQENIVNMLNYAANEFLEGFDDTKLPAFIRKLLTTQNALTALEAALQWNYLVSLPYTNIRWIEEMKGMSDATGIQLMQIVRLNLFPELTQASCTIVGAWGEATEGNIVRQLRALDWSPDAPVNQYPLITVYHSTEKGSNVFANIGFAGLVGSITAFSAKGIALSEKVWLPGKSVPYTYYGYPWMYVFRDLAQFSNNLSDAISRIYDTHRTQRIHIGIGSLEDNSFLGVEYSWKIVNIFNDKNQTYTPAHPQMNGVLYWDKHVQPSQDPCVGNVLEAGYGNINTEFLFRDVTGYHKTGDGQVCVFDFGNQEIWVSYSHGDSEDAYTRSPIRVQFRKLFESKKASSKGVFSSEEISDE